MKAKKKINNVVKWREPIKVNENLPSLKNDPVFLKKREEALKALRENPPPEWLLKRGRGEN